MEKLITGCFAPCERCADRGYLEYQGEVVDCYVCFPCDEDITVPLGKITLPVSPTMLADRAEYVTAYTNPEAA